MMHLHWSHGWGLAGQILSLWLIVAAALSPQIGKLLKARRAQLEFRAHLDRVRAAPLSPFLLLTPAQKAAIEKSDARWTDQDDSAFANEVDQPRRRA